MDLILYSPSLPLSILLLKVSLKFFLKSSALRAFSDAVEDAAAPAGV